MDLKAITNRATSRAARKLLVARKHSPTVLFGTGVVGVVATAVLASRATLKMDEVLREAEKRQIDIDTAVGERLKDGGTYNEDDQERDTKLNRVKTGLTIAKLYAPTIVTGAISVACLTGSHVILSRRNVSLTAAYAAVDQGFREYRKRVVDELGPGKDAEFRYGVAEREIAVDTDDGVAVKTVKVLNPNGKHSIYARPFDEANINWQSVRSYNVMFLSAQQSYANEKLRARGHVFLNEIYDALGMDRTKEGSIVGWVLNNPDGGDNYISFGVYDGDPYMGQEFVVGNEKSVWLDFNVDGVIWDKI